MISLKRMDKVREVDLASTTLTRDAGVLLQAAQQQAEEAHRLILLSFGPEDSCTIGGNLGRRQRHHGARLWLHPRWRGAGGRANRWLGAQPAVKAEARQLRRGRLALSLWRRSSCFRNRGRSKRASSGQKRR
ncbi:FAD-binding protein [Bradyrhizobium sp. UFLA05-112]